MRAGACAWDQRSATTQQLSGCQYSQQLHYSSEGHDAPTLRMFRFGQSYPSNFPFVLPCWTANHKLGFSSMLYCFVQLIGVLPFSFRNIFLRHEIPHRAHSFECIQGQSSRPTPFNYGDITRYIKWFSIYLFIKQSCTKFIPCT